MTTAFTGARVFDGLTLHDDAVLLADGARVIGLASSVPADADVIALGGGILSPGLIDLQVNGGGGLMVDGQCSAETLRAICATHAQMGTTGILPTLITDTAAATAHLIETAIDCIGAPGFLGLHLEGPHLDPRRKGAHDPRLIRPMGDQDLDVLISAARRLPAVMITVAPSAVRLDQIMALTQAGAIVSLGHTECTFAEAEAAFAAGARCATHLFNAMSQLGNREPGLVGAVLAHDIAAGIIADTIHVAPATLRIALAARPEGLFLVSDCMAAAGTDQTEFNLGGRKILRRNGRLTLEDGTLAGADLTLPQAIAIMVHTIGLPPERALAMATRAPAQVIGRDDLGHLNAGSCADLVHLSDEFQVQSVWQSGQKRL
ncbi:MAG: N-acetylglucosamine-6-phosphate deacetylase [Pseudotabrizicola sp.]|uniref:N-acetylglucosamine-6-phosphate deacetylase n=1 Tax=Pseudotabrizicola sp. TaxID=2939647 RepID=UPI00271C0E12|nr:N-acetylglucosamine-6-phosphate deacetylase [Pseudotabrizicola sp.]MDO8883873.1 N-acetylglucosamine-6-phosphate deacetylase [Pseudotabrizicola sp.]MDP2081216.1 N-acetylglucosamine-6-phosphate deacetylase [Pseudotabrizicola sp.]MDZ7576165.1 N-acetylglucosamine-6-phosphate deacetylase [Pseudotabrizicola sp.]